MFTMFNRIFAMFTSFAQFGEKLGISLNNLGDIGVEMSGSYADEQRLLRAAKNASLKLEHNIA